MIVKITGVPPSGEMRRRQEDLRRILPSLLMAALVASILLLMGASGGVRAAATPSAILVNDTYFGNFLLAPGKDLSEGDVFTTVQGRSLCKSLLRKVVAVGTVLHICFETYFKFVIIFKIIIPEYSLLAFVQNAST